MISQTHSGIFRYGLAIIQKLLSKPFSEEEYEAMLLVDASNAFNPIKKKTLLLQYLN